MSTVCKITCDDHYGPSQVLSEILWLNGETRKVKREMQRRPSKLRHLRDLERQLQQKYGIIERSGFSHLIPPNV